MRKVILYIAQSIDGKIAKPDGSVKWLEEMPVPENEDFGYQKLLDSVDTVLMGNKTFQQARGFDMPYPYADKTSYIFTRDQSQEDKPGIHFICENIPEFVQRLKVKEGKDIWLIGGAQINTLFLKNNLIDEIILFTMPILIGEGIPLFESGSFEQQLQLKSNKTYPNGTIEAIYSCIQ